MDNSENSELIKLEFVSQISEAKHEKDATSSIPISSNKVIKTTSITRSMN